MIRFCCRSKCIHGNESHCNLCNNTFGCKSYEISRKESQKTSSSEDAKLSSIPKSMVLKTVESQKSARDKKHSNSQNIHENGIQVNGTALSTDMNGSHFLGDPMEEYEQHTKLCRTNSGRTFESHSYYAIERRKETLPEYDTIRKIDSERQSKANFFSTSVFQKELKESVRKKARDFEKRTRKYQSCDYDSDESDSDVREMRHRRPHIIRNQKKSPGESREPSFSRNHPLRNGARVRSQINGHISNGKSPSYLKNPNNRAIMPQQRVPSQPTYNCYLPILHDVILHDEESATIALRKFRVQKNVKSGKGPLTSSGLLKLVKRFEETGKFKDRARAGRLYLKEARAPCIAVEMEAIASEAASGTSSAREAARRLGLPPSSVRNILRRILQLYPYKLQSCHKLLPADTAQREAFAKWAFSKMEQDPTWVFNILWTDEAHFSLHGDVNNHNCRIWATSNPREYTQKPLHSPKVTAWCGFMGSFIIGPFFFETQYPVNGWIMETVSE
ncbi:uncharacterized protein TNCV_1113371 [Trichonephila clavipes]|nr:uncharacterized protein TNCV_1113371 [Trichonephila clavipes]